MFTELFFLFKQPLFALFIKILAIVLFIISVIVVAYFCYYEDFSLIHSILISAIVSLIVSGVLTLIVIVFFHLLSIGFFLGVIGMCILVAFFGWLFGE